jgi:glucose/arabinose dehydrogenase
MFNLILEKLFILSIFILTEAAVPHAINAIEPSMSSNDFIIETVASGIQFPTSMTFLSNDDILVLEKDTGRIQRIVNGDILDEPFLDVNVSNKGERGLLGIAVTHNEDGEAEFLYVFYTESGSNDGDSIQSPLGNRLYRYVLEDNEPLYPELLLDIPLASSRGTGYHNGGKLATDNDQRMYVTVGDLDHHETTSQNQYGSEFNGTSVIYSIDESSSIQTYNNELENFPSGMIYAYGIRNSFGLDFDPVTGNLWDTENGPDHGDEVNYVEPGFNSGWSKIQGMSYLDDNFSINDLVDFNGEGKYSDPEFVWNIPVGPTAIKFINSDKYGKEYENDILVGDINNGNIYHFDLNKDRTELLLDGPLKDKVADTPEEAESAIFARGFGGITDIQVGPDGYIYVAAISEFASLRSQLDKSHASGTIFRIMP